MRSSIFALALGSLTLAFACGGSGDGADASNPSGTGTSTSTASSQGTGASSSSGKDATSTTTGTSTSSGGSGTGSSTGGGSSGSGTPFSYGMNDGYYNGDLNDVVMAQMGLTVGSDSERAKLTEPFLDTWGDDIHVSEMQQFQAMGVGDLVCMTIGASADHSNAPAGGNVENWSPKNLYEKIFNDDGTVNKNNYWAAFMERVVTNYSPYIHQWEIWNEPDQVGGNWQATQTWDTTPPKPSDLVWWNDTIYAYIRLLRISSAVAKKIDPQAKITLGGIGYSGFLDAILRYTDEPNAGAVDADHPSKGDAYFDEVSFHYYPVFTAGSSDDGANGILTSLKSYQAVFSKYGVAEKPYIITESGAPRYQLGSYPGGVDYAKNYLLKAMALAQDAGIRRIDWFILGDGADPGASQDSFQYMGLFQNLSNVHDPASAIITPSGVAYGTIGKLLKGSLSDPAATKALGLASGTNGVALTMPDGKRAYVVWTSGADENASGSVTLPLSSDGTVYAWDYSTTNMTTTASQASGKVTVPVTSAPVIVVGTK